MSEPRTPARDGYDAIVDLATNPEWGPYALALVKLTYRIGPRGWERAAPEPLLYDLRDEKQEPRLVPGTDFWPAKRLTDVVVQGSAFAPGGTPTDRMQASVTVGGLTKRVAVFGRRELFWTDRGTPRFGAPEPCTEVPLTWAHAYGGVDWRVVDPELPEWDPLAAIATLAVDHPGLYPRNPFGKGYLVETEPVEGLELPQLEDPDDLLTPERLVVRDPRNWFAQPMPWSFEWVHPMMFPRFAYFMLAPDAWYPGPEDARLTEVRRGLLAPGYRTALGFREVTDGPEPTFFQEASHGMTFRDLPPATPIRIAGMHPEEPQVTFQLPPPPLMEMEVDGKRAYASPRLHHVACRPAEKVFTAVYGATMPIERLLIPGIHKHIPLAVSVNGEPPIYYDAPVPMRDRLAEAMAAPAKG